MSSRRYFSAYDPAELEELRDLSDEPVMAGTTVLVDEDRPVDTGLLDANGVRLYRVSERVKVGYIK
jgi:hypothetical protein